MEIIKNVGWADRGDGPPMTSVRFFFLSPFPFPPSSGVWVVGVGYSVGYEILVSDHFRIARSLINLLLLAKEFLPKQASPPAAAPSITSASPSPQPDLRAVRPCLLRIQIQVRSALLFSYPPASWIGTGRDSPNLSRLVPVRSSWRWWTLLAVTI